MVFNKGGAMKRFEVVLLALMATAFACVQAQPVQTENVVLITLDGLRWQELFTGADSSLVWNEEFVDDAEVLAAKFWRDTPEERRQQLMPFFWEVVAENGVVYGNRQLGNKVDVTNGHVFSYPGYNEILTGFADETIDSNDKIPNENVTVLEWLNRQPEFSGKVAAFASWDVFPYIINEDRSGIPVNAGFENVTGSISANISEKEALLNRLQSEVVTPWSWERFDAITHHLALEHLAVRQPRVLYLAYGDTDELAHAGDYAGYLDGTRRTDAYIEEIWNWIQSSAKYRGKTSLVIATDHGRGWNERWVGHGVDWEGSSAIWMAVIGPDTPSLGEVADTGQLYQNQIAATVAALLGLEYNNTQPVGRPVLSAIR